MNNPVLLIYIKHNGMPTTKIQNLLFGVLNSVFFFDIVPRLWVLDVSGQRGDTISQDRKSIDVPTRTLTLCAPLWMLSNL